MLLDFAIFIHFLKRDFISNFPMVPWSELDGNNLFSCLVLRDGMGINHIIHQKHLFSVNVNVD
jgi:hypothetical protein